MILYRVAAGTKSILQGKYQATIQNQTVLYNPVYLQGKKSKNRSRQPMRASASCKTNPPHTQSIISGACKRKKLGWPSFRWFKSKETSKRNLDENDEKAQLAERILAWQQESSREEICAPIFYAVDSTMDKIKTQTLKETEIRT